MNSIFESSFIEHINVAKNCLSNLGCDFSEVEQVIRHSLGKGQKVLVFGNGGSAADADHFAAELVVKFGPVTKALPAMSLVTSGPILTAICNDFDAKYVFSRQIEAYGRPKDIALAITTSGNSDNVIEGIQKAKEMNLTCVALNGGDGGVLSGLVDHEIIVNSSSTARVQEMHAVILHSLCASITARLT